MIQYLRELHFASVVVRLALAMLLGGCIGLERGRKRRPAGFRTYMLVCLGAALTVLLSLYEFTMVTGPWSDICAEIGIKTDVSRFGAQVINGIGFLGAGTIIVTKRNQIKGLTTAAGLWTSACAGLALGIGLYEVAAPACLSIFVIFTVLHELDFRMRRKSRQIDAFVELRKNTSIRDFLASVREQNFDPSNLLLQPDSAESVDSVTFTITLKSRVARSHEESMCLLRTLGSVSYIEEL